MKMDPINETILLTQIPAIAPLAELVHDFIVSAQWLFGGMFGLYVILIFLRWRESRMVGKILTEIRNDIRQLSKDIKYVNDKVNGINVKKQKVVKR